MDNAGFHYTHMDEILAACHSRGVLVICLPPYSPDLNPIEEFFAVLKAFIRRTYRQEYQRFDSYQDYIQWALQQCGTRDKACKNA